MYFNIHSGSCAPAESQGQGAALFGAPRMQHDLPSLATVFSQTLSWKAGVTNGLEPVRHPLAFGTKTRKVKGLCLGILVSSFGLLISWTPFGLDVEEKYGLAWLFGARGSRPPPESVLIIAADRRSSKQSGWPEKPEQWPRDVHARLLQKLHQACARVVAFDFFFGSPRRSGDDQSFARAIRRAGNVVLAGHLGILEDELIPSVSKENIQTTYLPIAALAEAAAGVAPFPLPNTPDSVNGFWLFKKSAGDIPTLPTLAFQIYALDVYDDFLRLLTKVSAEQTARLPPSKEQIVVSKGITDLALRLRELFESSPIIGKQMLAELNDGSHRPLTHSVKHTIKALINLYQSDDWQYLNFYGPARSINTITYPDAIELTRSPIKCDEENIFTGKVVFIGMSETSPVEQKDKDIFDTVYTGPSGLKLAGVEIAATAAANLIEDMPVRRLAYLPTSAIIIGWGLFVSVLWRSYMTVIASWITVGAASIYFGLAFYVFRTNAMWYPLVIPLLQMLVGSALAVARNRRDLEIRVAAIRQTLTEWLPADAIERIITSPEIVRKASGLVYATCLHSDVEGFTSISEDMDPIDLSSVMNEYFKTIGQPVIRRGGFVSDQTGDSMLAIWAAAEPDVYLRHQACAGALDICEALNRFHQTSEYPSFATRIGLHAGQIAVGGVRIGTTQHHRSFGLIVNTAQRIQSLNKLLRTRILASRDVIEGLSDFMIRPVGIFGFAGITLPLDIYEILRRRPAAGSTPATGDLAWLCAAFADALDAYKDGEWQASSDQLLKILEYYQEDGPTRFYIRQCEYYKHHPPPGFWSPVIHK
ncbi:MAG: CHASE2 domain-containing protein [Gammaproteobacteria bacterium]